MASDNFLREKDDNPFQSYSILRKIRALPGALNYLSMKVWTHMNPKKELPFIFHESPDDKIMVLNKQNRKQTMTMGLRRYICQLELAA